MNKNNDTKITFLDSGTLYTLGVIILFAFSVVLSSILQYNPNFENSTWFLILSYFLAPLSLTCAIILTFKKNKTAFFSGLKINKPSKKTVLAFLLLTFGFLFGLSSVNEVFANFLYNLGYKKTQTTLPNFTVRNFILVLLFVCIIPAFVEEVFFRAIITKGLTCFGKITAVVLSGLLFSIFHMNPLQTIYQFLTGCIFALIVLYGGNYILTFISHFLNNFMVVIVYYFLSGIQNFILTLILAVLGIIAIVLGTIILLLGNKDKNETKREKFNPIILIGVAVCLITWVLNFSTNIS